MKISQARTHDTAETKIYKSYPASYSDEFIKKDHDTSNLTAYRGHI